MGVQGMWHGFGMGVVGHVEGCERGGARTRHSWGRSVVGMRDGVCKECVKM